MKKIAFIVALGLAAITSSAFAAEDVKDAKAQQYAKEISKLQQDLAIKQAEYDEYIKSLDLKSAESDVKLRGGSASQCSYQCNLYHRDDYYMWSQCFRACTD